MPILMFDYLPQYQRIKREILEAISQVLDSGRLILGPRVKAFEDNFSRFLGQGGFSMGVGNGTDALAIALRALEVGPGDQVITVANTAVATVAAIRMVGAAPLFCEIDPKTLLMDLERAESCITAQTRAIVPVHLFGNAVDMDAVLALARRYKLRVVEDCAQSCGTTFRGRPTGTWGDVGCFSFYPTKNLGAYGDGGLCFTGDEELAGKIRRIRAYGCGADRNAECEGVNSRLDEIQAAVLDVKLRYLCKCLQERRYLAAAYLEHLQPDCRAQRVTVGARHSYHLFVIQTNRRDSLVSRLKAEGIGHGIHYPVPIHLMAAYRFLGYKEGALPITEAAASRILSLPCYPGLSSMEVQKVCSIVNDVTEELQRDASGRTSGSC
jgi:dTDP-3-amino-2,3,6-trideoxy-4-keto-D-glucose/dTDP-3-amino-3,4,6-trideoxy-alpha-D-glucose/dTDP-2,6-dideoxy-D-kanosamine transaminase